MKIFEVWVEGFAVTGNDSGATLMGVVNAESFNEACDKVLPDNEYKRYEPKTAGSIMVVGVLIM